MPKPLVSVVIPTHNYGRFLDDALESVFAQTYHNLEVIVVDDGSTDDTRKRIKEFEGRVRYVYQSNAGPASARNAGIQLSQGTYLAFLDADDVWLPRRVESQAERLEAQPDVGAVYTWWAYMDETGTPMPQTATPTHKGQVLEQLVMGSFVTLPMCMVRRECFERAGLLDPTLQISEDWDIVLRIARAGYKFTCVPEVLMRNRLHPEHLSGDLLRKLEYDCRVLSKAFSGLAHDEHMEILRRRAYFRLFVSAAFELLCRGDWAEGIRWFTEGLRLRPEELERAGFYLNFALQLLPHGQRTMHRLTTCSKSISMRTMAVFDRLFSQAGLPSDIACRKRVARSNLTLVWALVYAKRRQWIAALTFLAKAFAIQPATPFLAVIRRIRTARTTTPGRSLWRDDQ